MAAIECVPNISEGRRADVIARCADAIRGAGVSLLDVSADAAHNRAVFTFVGRAADVEAAALALIDRAVALIDLRRHAGEHPRIGAVDVVPFVPLDGATTADAASLARSVGAEAARRHGLPVFLYEDAATSPARRNLADVRRGGFEALAARLRDPAWAPDFGPAAPHPSAGAVAIGARRPLVAYNVNLASGDVTIARRIAAEIRESSGGLPWVKALGIALAERGVVQVSMNLTNIEVTPMLAAFEAVRAAATRAGVAIVDSELIGLAPAAAFPPDPARTIHLRDFGPDRILENRLSRT